MAHSRIEHLAMMQTPRRWPHKTILPLMKGGFRGQEGFLLLEPGKRLPDPTVRIGNAFMYGMTGRVERLVTYESFEAMLDDGWEVD